MNKLNINKIKEDKKLYALLTNICQLLPDLKGIFSALDESGKHRLFFLVTDAAAEELSILNNYLFGSSLDNLPIFVGVTDANDSNIDNVADFDLSAILDVVNATATNTVEGDLRNLFILTTDANMKLYTLNELVVWSLYRSAIPNSQLANYKAAISALTNFAYTYVRYGKRAAYNAFKACNTYKDDINKICLYFKLDPIFI